MESYSTFSGTIFAAAGEKGHGMSFWGLAFYVVLVLAVILGTMAYAKTGLSDRVFKNPLTRLYEHVYIFVKNLCVSIIGPHGERFVPMMFTFWIVIFVGNITALLFPTSPTADLSFNLGMALIAVGYVQYAGIVSQYEHLRHEGVSAAAAIPKAIFRHLMHFTGPRLPLVLIPISGLIFVVELISEVMKNVSLSLRLYGNIDGGHQAADAMNKLLYDYYIPVGAFLMPIKLLTCIVQALIFCLLTCVYISLVTHHEEESHDTKEAHAAAH